MKDLIFFIIQNLLIIWKNSTNYIGIRFWRAWTNSSYHFHLFFLFFFVKKKIFIFFFKEKSFSSFFLYKNNIFSLNVLFINIRFSLSIKTPSQNLKNFFLNLFSLLPKLFHFFPYKFSNSIIVLSIYYS